MPPAAFLLWLWSAAATEPGWLGCFQEQVVSEFAHADAVEADYDAAACAVLCDGLGAVEYSFYGLQRVIASGWSSWHNKCYCSSSEPAARHRLATEECGDTCTGQSGSCGPANSVAVYKAQEASTSTTTSAPFNWKLDDADFQLMSPCENGCICSPVGNGTSKKPMSSADGSLGSCAAGCRESSINSYTECVAIEYNSSAPSCTYVVMPTTSGQTCRECVETAPDDTRGDDESRESRCYRFFRAESDNQVAPEDALDPAILAICIAAGMAAIACCLIIAIMLCRKRHQKKETTLHREGVAQLDDQRVAQRVIDSYPRYWNNAGTRTIHEFQDMFYVPHGELEAFRVLAAETYVGKVTRDRRCPVLIDGEPLHKKPPGGGCECVQPGAVPGLPEGYAIRGVMRVENSTMWKKYSDKRGNILNQHKDIEDVTRKLVENHQDLKGWPHNVLTYGATRRCEQCFSNTQMDNNEIYLWHGTKIEAALRITDTAFSMSKVGTATGLSMFGSGLYFAESLTKADEYALTVEDEKNHYQHIHAALLCRVFLGKIYHARTKNEDAFKRPNFHQQYDSTLGTAGLFKEFVIYDHDQVYPEYIVFYSRLLKDDDGKARIPEKAKILSLAEKPFFIELPVYWRNCHKHPRNSFFHEIHDVRKFQREELLPCLLREPLTRLHVQLRDNLIPVAKRIENAKLWNRLDDKRKEFISTISKGRPFIEEHALLKRPIEPFRALIDSSIGERSKHMFSIDDMSTAMNERMLWLLKSPDPSQITQFTKCSLKDRQAEVEAFNPEVTGDLGRGIYLTDDFSQAFSQAALGQGSLGGNAKCVMLCRVACGQLRKRAGADTTTMDNLDPAYSCLIQMGAGVNASATFVIRSVSQLYPEYVLEIRT